MLFAAIFFFAGCKQITKVTDVITQPSPREVYARNFKNDTLRYAKWKTSFERAQHDSLFLKMPYLETGRFTVDDASAYNLKLQQGEVLHVDVENVNNAKKVFLDLLKKTGDSIQTYKSITHNDLESTSLEYTVEKTGDYKFIIQPEMGASSLYMLKIYRTPLYHFPVTGKGNAAIQSFWGANRDGGRRSHEGLDIFAARGTPVVAATDGRVSSTGNRGLGGKQVWLRSGIFGNSLYYAHLDSIATTTGKRIKTGDTLGFVGNTGNARTTPPHLHFGIYQGRNGAVNPLPYVFEGTAPLSPELTDNFPEKVVVTSSRANLRASAFAKAIKLGETRRNDTLQVIGRTNEWLHIRTPEGRPAYIFEGLTKVLNK